MRDFCLTAPSEPASGPSSGEDGDEVDRLGDEGAGHGDHRLLDQLFKAPQSADRRAGVEGANAARMSGAPGFQEIERFGSAHLANRDAVRPKPQGRADKVGQRGCALLGPKRDEVRGCALQLAGVLDEDHPVAGLCDLGEDCVDERRLAGRCAAGDQNVLAIADGRLEQRRLRVRHDPGGDIVVEGEHRDRGASNGEAWSRGDRRDEAFEPLAAFRQLSRDAWTAGMDLDADMVSDKPDDAFCVNGRDAEARILQSACEAVDPEPAVGVQHHLGDGRIFEVPRYRRTKRGAQHARAASVGFRSKGDSRHVQPYGRASTPPRS